MHYMRVSRGVERAGTLGDQPRPAAPAVVGLEPLARHRPVRLQPDQHLQATVRCVQDGQRAPGGQTRGRQRAGAARARSGSAGAGPPCCSRRTAAPSRSCSWCGAQRRSRGTAASPRGSHPRLTATRSPSGRRSWTGSSGCRAAQSGTGVEFYSDGEQPISNSHLVRVPWSPCTRPPQLPSVRRYRAVNPWPCIMYSVLAVPKYFCVLHLY